MLIDTHCHINMMIKKKFDIPITSNQLPHAKLIIDQAAQCQVNRIINVGTSIIESQNCIELARAFEHCYATVGIHPNDLTRNWQKEIQQLKDLVREKEPNKIIAIGEIGFDKHYPGYNIQRQKDAFRAQVDLALEFNLPIVIHTREAPEETLDALSVYKKEPNFSGVIHCFSEDQTFADHTLDLGFFLGIGGTLTYPQNDALREVFKNVDLGTVILESDAPFLPPQIMRGKQNHPKYILTIAEFFAELRGQDLKEIAQQTTKNACALFGIVD